MSKSLNLLTATAALSLLAGPALAESFGLGRPALPEEIAAWDLDVSPDGTGLPPGSGSVEDGETLFSENCAVCHGEFAEGVGNWPELAGGDGTLANDDPVKTVGSYWPYLSTAWDYVHRSMPFGNAQSLSVDEVYAITAYILYSNFIVEDDFVLSHENFLDVEMPNADGFIVDDRPETEYAQWRAEPCMEDCKDEVKIVMRATVLDVTPEETAQAMAVAQAADPEVDPAPEPVEAAVQAKTEGLEAPDPALVSEGEAVFRKCKACHMVGEGAKNRTGPPLNDIVGAKAGAVEGFRYSKALEEAAAGGLVWDHESLASFLEKPRDYMKGTKMSFPGLRTQEEIDAVIAYLQSFQM